MSIFEKIGEKLSGAGQGVAQQVKNFADVARLNSIISEKEKQIAQLYIEIGQAYYHSQGLRPSTRRHDAPEASGSPRHTP